MEIIIWLIISLLFIVSFVGLIFPLIPGILLIWAGFLLYVFTIGENLTIWFWIGMIILTAIIFVADIIANSYFVKRYGGSKWGERMAVLGVIVGAFVTPPFGIIIVPFVAVVVTEYLIQKDGELALKIGAASLVAFLSSTFAKFIMQMIMITWFLISVIF
ncbi:uncharacterized protein YqgC (DUF456 family) [Evansella vedderi]|uniref:Uncharacterized protein YqgC (DUF456 family) n=1 Tax=Evansella vedderi TaxID=38282 RepID=A0ABU0A2E8_9BACI|nr:DUF456 domain-containing protein [Evansella vedderi]MDQ0256868.1 uncharacterized protein YqgC (DUF456 family) [Evansella vedderi]